MKINLRDVFLGKIREGIARCYICQPCDGEYAIYMNTHTFYFFQAVMIDEITYYKEKHKLGDNVVAKFDGIKILIDQSLSNYEIKIDEEKEN